MFRNVLTGLIVALMFGTAASAAQANHVQPNLGIDVISVDPASRTVQGIVHCTTPDRAGRPETFTVVRDIQFDQFRPGARWGIAVAPNNVILSTGDMPCQAPGGPQGPLGGPQGPFGGPQAPGGPGMPGGPEGDEPSFARGFLNRVWKFDVSIDDVTSGKMSITIEKVRNLPKRYAAQDDDLVDEDAIVLLGSSVRVYRDGKRVSKSQLDDAEAGRVQGKLLPPRKWQSDEDEQKVPTIRAKKIYLS